MNNGFPGEVLRALVYRKVASAIHREKVAGVEVRAPGLLRQSASAAWRMHPPSAKPKTTKPNTNPSARGQEVTKLKPPSNRSYHKDLIESLHNPQRGFRITTMG